MTKSILILVSLLMLAPRLFSQPGMLDTTFGNQGVASYPMGGGSALAIQPDGKIPALALVCS